MAISRVQYTGNLADDTTTVTCATTSNVTSGNLLVIYAIKYSPSGSDVFVIGDISKSAGTCTLGSFTLDVDHVRTFGSEGVMAAVYSAPITGTGSCTIQVTGDSGCWFLLALEELSGIDVSETRLEDTNEAVGESTAPASGDATSAAGAIFCGAVAVASPTAVVFTEDAAFTLLYEQQTVDHMTGSAASRIVSSGTTDAASWAIDVTEEWVAVVAVYKEGVGVASVTLDPATLTATGIPLDVVPGAKSILLDPSTLTATAIPFTVSAPESGLVVVLETG